MANDLVWFPFFVDDWLGGTLSMLQADLGAYLQALIAQWKSGDFQAIKDEKKSLRIVCRGPMSSPVREKFVSITIKGERYLRNKRLAEIYDDQAKAHLRRSEKASKAAQARYKDAPSTPPSTASGMLPQNPDSIRDSKVGSFKKENNTPINGGAGSKNRSKFPYDQCLEFARAQDGINKPEAFATTIRQSGEWDDQIEAFFAKPRKRRIVTPSTNLP